MQNERVIVLGRLRLRFDGKVLIIEDDSGGKVYLPASLLMEFQDVINSLLTTC